MTATREDVEKLAEDRPYKLAPEELNYGPAPPGSAMRCASCFHLYWRATDNHTICELIRSEQIDDEGIYPDYRCDAYTLDGFVMPLWPEEEPKVAMAEYGGDDPT